MGEFLTQYWLQVFLGLAATGVSIAVKGYFRWTFKKFQEDRQKILDELTIKMREELIEEGRRLKEESDEADLGMAEEMDELSQGFEVLKKGLLSIQERQFKDTCQRLLAKGHKLTLDEYRQCSAEHAVYKSLGGNHDGDDLYKLVEKKAEKLLADNSINENER